MYRLYKKEKLCSAVAVDRVFSRGAGNFTVASFPVRAFFCTNPGRKSDAPVQFLISVPKKRLRHAVDRVKMRRRIREAYRLNHGNYPLPDGVKIDVAFVYVDSRMHSYQRIAAAMQNVLQALAHYNYGDTAVAPDNDSCHES